MVKVRFGPQFTQVFNAENDNHERVNFAIQSNNAGSVNNANSFDDLNYPYNTGPWPGNCCGFPIFVLFVNSFPY
jgi:hypothetical protein